MAEKVSDKNKEFLYYTHISNIVDELDLSPLAIALYFHYKRWQHAEYKNPITVKDLMKKYKCGSPAIRKAKAELIAVELITIDESQRHLGIADEVEITDIVERNFEHFKAKNRVTDQQQPSYRSATGRVTNQQLDLLLIGNALKKDKRREIEKEEREQEPRTLKPQAEGKDLNAQANRPYPLPDSEEDSSPPPRAIEIYQEFYLTHTMNGGQFNVFAERMRTVNETIWRETLEDWQLNGYKSGNIAGMIDAYHNKLKKLQQPVMKNGFIEHSTKPKSKFLH